MCLMAASAIVTGILGSVPLSVKAADYEARIGDTHYEELEEAFANAQAGDTITVLKDCSVSGTLEVTLDNITLRSEDAGNPATISLSAQQRTVSDRLIATNIAAMVSASATSSNPNI